MLGIALGVLALIAVLSVINASTSTMRAETLKAVPHAGIVVPEAGQSWQQLVQTLTAQPGVVAAAPFVSGEAWLRFEGHGEFVNVRGVDPRTEHEVLQQPDEHLRMLLQELANNPDGVILGARLAARLGVFTGSTLAATPLSALLAGENRGGRSFQVLGVADFGFYDSESLALVALPQA